MRVSVTDVLIIIIALRSGRNFRKKSKQHGLLQFPSVHDAKAPNVEKRRSETT